MFFTLLLFFVGFYILIKGAGFLVDGSSSLARRFHISNLVIGLVIAGIGTSIPEFSISFIANLFGEGEVGLGTIIGSNTFNILFILGVSALFFPLRLKPEWVHRDMAWNIIAVFVAASFAIPLGDGTLSRFEGFFMLALFSFWLYVTIKKSNSVNYEEGEPFRVLTFPIAAGLILAGLLGVILGGKWVVDGAVLIARELGMSEGLIGLTIVGIGTSLPEFAVTFVAALRGQPGIAVGNIIGSNIFDFLMILGFGALIRPIDFPPHLFLDMIITMLSASILYGFMFMGEIYVLKRSQGLFLIFLYVIYVLYVIGRG
jgi:cation:H+ antiporter